MSIQTESRLPVKSYRAARRHSNDTMVQTSSEQCATTVKGCIVDITFATVEADENIKIEQPSVHDIIYGRGPEAIMQGSSHDIRWIHIPCNSMALVDVSVQHPQDKASNTSSI